jgi:hypothetical protein
MEQEAKCTVLAHHLFIVVSLLTHKLNPRSIICRMAHTPGLFFRLKPADYESKLPQPAYL